MKSFFLICVASLVAAVAANAASFEPLLEKQLREDQSGKFHSVIIKLYNPRSINDLDQELHARKAPLAERHRLVIEALKANAAETQGPIQAKLEEAKLLGEVNGFTAYWIENLFVIHGTARAILTIADDPAVESVGPNFRAELIDPIMRGPIRGHRPPEILDTPELTTPGQDAIRATEVNRVLGFNGAGVLVANLDTGVDRFHPALGSRWRGTHAPVAECWLDRLGGIPLPQDNNSHGTHVMGTECGREIQADGDTITVGSAPLAEWIACNAIGGFGQDFSQDVLDAYEWFIDPDGNPNTLEDLPDVIQNSWGVNTGLGYAQCYQNWNTAITNCEAAGPVITWSAGNEAQSGLRAPAIFELNATQIFSVAAVDANPNSPPFPIADFSSRGPTPCQPNQGSIKPEIAAPGVDVYSSIPGGQYTDGFSGTSMAGPHVAGCVGLMREACPDCDPQTIKEAIMATAIDVGYPPAGPDNNFGAGFIDCYEAVLAVASLGRVDGFVQHSNGSPVPAVRVTADGLNNSTMTGANGYYNLSAAEGTYTLRFTKFGYETAVVNNVVTTEGDTTHLDVTMNPLPNGTLRPTVVTQLGVPLQGVVCTFANVPVDTFTTNALGQFEVTLPADTYFVHLHFVIERNPPVIIDEDTSVIVLANQTVTPNWPLFIAVIEPAGPDAYGYRAYDRYDRDFPAPYDWLELNPTFGGVGTPFTYSGGDACVHFDAPFPIGFYGVDYDSLTVNTNGWMLPGIHFEEGQNNTQIPSDANGDPSGVIAPFWDNVRSGFGATQFSYLDRATSRWIFQFSDQQLQAPGGRFHNWQVQFMDPARYPSLTGDAQIVFVYHRMDYLNSATIGIEDTNETRGIQIQHNQSLDPTAWPIEEGAAIRFTTGLPTTTGTLNGTIVLYPNQGEAAGLHVWAAGQDVVMNAQGQFSAPGVPAVNGVAMMDQPGFEVVHSARTQIPAGGSASVNLQSWRLDPPRDLSATQTPTHFTLRWRTPESVSAMANPAVRYDFYMNGVLRVSSHVDTFITQGYSDAGQVTFTLKAVYPGGVSDFSVPLVYFLNGAAADDDMNSVPTAFALHSNYPNPFNPSTSIRIDVPNAIAGKLSIFDIQGRMVANLFDGNLTAGVHRFEWNGRDMSGRSVATGIYLYKFESSIFTDVKKMALIK